MFDWAEVHYIASNLTSLHFSPKISSIVGEKRKVAVTRVAANTMKVIAPLVMKTVARLFLSLSRLKETREKRIETVFSSFHCQDWPPAAGVGNTHTGRSLMEITPSFLYDLHDLLNTENILWRTFQALGTTFLLVFRNSYNVSRPSKFNGEFYIKIYKWKKALSSWHIVLVKSNDV